MSDNQNATTAPGTDPVRQPKEKHNLRWDGGKWARGMAKCNRIGTTMTDVMERALDDFLAETDETAALRLDSRLAVTLRAFPESAE